MQGGSPVVTNRQKQTRATLRTRYKDPARDKAREWDELLQRGIDPVVHERSAVTINEFITKRLDLDEGPWPHSPTRM